MKKNNDLGREGYVECFSLRISPSMKETIALLKKRKVEINQPVRVFLERFLRQFSEELNKEPIKGQDLET